MEDGVGAVGGPGDGRGVVEPADEALDAERLQAAEVAGGADQRADVPSALRQSPGQVASDEAGGPGDQCDSAHGWP
ncbi:MAG TPA: hypothetical protein VHG91_19140 [Longimicrobium sp.]|nr:hypothetical protein [Longimicrobium sp.]